MNKLFQIFFLLIILSANLHATEGKCFFEEVYKNGEKQNGLFLISEDSIRYEYFDQNLFTIIYQNNKFFLIQNRNKNIFDNINDQRINLFQHLVNIVKSYPNIEEQFKIQENLIVVEKSETYNFPKRISIKSKKLNLSIFLFECSNEPINKLFFNFDPLFEYPR